MSIQKKLIVVGDGGCGKTCLLIAFAKDIFLSDYKPTVFENYVADVEVDGKTIELSLWDTSGQEDYDRLRPIQYPDTDVAIICFSVMWPTSLENVTTRWWPEVKHFCPDIPIVLVGTKNDLREDQDEVEMLMRSKKKPVTSQEAEIVAKKIKAVCYVESSAKTKFNVHKVFATAAAATVTQRKRDRLRRTCKLI
ncbi:Ras and/or Miro domain containing protein [Asbolus verrucosus]|uniref:Ras and/or Miro domain containing protein n=1 Tax=Asbolus verrucosus TaxID=1661398 RepID=A0A482W9P4_ASBVE|nr:Ras and/or Miro domain containing protein [Asbolus verrucosus]